jgi:hypothetical protein
MNVKVIFFSLSWNYFLSSIDITYHIISALQSSSISYLNFTNLYGVESVGFAIPFYTVSSSFP